MRVVVVADTDWRARALASLWAEDERLEIIAASGELRFREAEDEEEQAADVAVVVALSPDRIPPFACPVVVLNDSPEANFIAGAKLNAWLPLHSSLQEVSAAIFAAACDLAVFTPRQLRDLRGEAADGDHSETAAVTEKLTARELQVLRMLADGLGNKQIAGELGLSDHTAKFHVAQILAKLGVGSRTEAVTIGFRRGLVPL